LSVHDDVAGRVFRQPVLLTTRVVRHGGRGAAEEALVGLTSLAIATVEPVVTVVSVEQVLSADWTSQVGAA